MNSLSLESHYAVAEFLLFMINGCCSMSVGIIPVLAAQLAICVWNL